MSDIFKELYAVDVNEHKQGKNGLSYLSWTWAWAELMKLHPDATVEIVHFDGKPYLYDENLGYMVETIMTIDGVSRMMWLPVMNNVNKAMKDKPYTYLDRYKKERTVEAATMFDINTAIMRCMTKNIALFGLGLYIYAGEDLPIDENAEKQKPEQEYTSDLDELASEKDKKIAYSVCKNANKSMNAWMKKIGKTWDELTNRDIADLNTMLAGEQK